MQMKAENRHGNGLHFGQKKNRDEGTKMQWGPWQRALRNGYLFCSSVYQLDTCDGETKGLHGAQCQPGVHSEFWVSLG